MYFRNRTASASKHRLIREWTTLPAFFLVSALTVTADPGSSDGTPNEAFREKNGAGFNSASTTAITQADGKIPVGGGFREFDGEATPRLVSMWPDGALDAEFAGDIDSGFNDTDGAPGEITATASHEGDPYYLPAEPVEQTLTVLAVPEIGRVV